jgi:hypothetical protein
MDRTVLAVRRLHTAAQCDEVFVGVDNNAFGRLGGSWVVLAIIEGYPPPSELFTSANLWPGQSTAHSLFLDSPRRGVPNGPRLDAHVPVV